MIIFLIFCIFLTSKDIPKSIKKQHENIKKKCKGYVYFIKNSHGYFSVCVQKHFKHESEGLASYYVDGERTAVNKPFNTNHFTAAHPYIPIPCIVEVVDSNNPLNRLVVKVNDRGPLVHNQDVIIDLTYAGAKAMGFLREGHLKVRIKVLEKETKLLKEYGGPISWEGEVPFEVAFNGYI